MRQCFVTHSPPVDVRPGDPEAGSKRTQIEKFLTRYGYLEQNAPALGIPVNGKESVTLLHAAREFGNGLCVDRCSAEE